MAQRATSTYYYGVGLQGGVAHFVFACMYLFTTVRDARTERRRTI